jgi:hypothetical protein
MQFLFIEFGEYMSIQQSLDDSASSWFATIRSGVIPFFLLAHSEEGECFRQVDEVPPIVFDKGRVLFDCFTVTSAQFDNDSISWAHQSDRGYTSGHLTYARSGTELHGFVSIGDDADTATRTDVYATALPLSEYETTLSGSAQDGPVLRIGIRPGEGFASRVSVFLDETDVTDLVCQSLEPASGRPVLDIVLPEQGGDGLPAGAAHLVFDIGQFGEVSFTGNITGIGSDGEVTFTDWTGKRRMPVVEHALVEPEAPALAFVDAVLPSGENALSEAEIESPEVQRAILTLLGKVPNDNDVSAASSTYMMENMKYAMWKDASNDDVTSQRKWMENYFKEQIPSIADQPRIDTIMKDAGWYRNTMATAIFGNSLGTQVFDKKVVPRPIDDTRKASLKNYVETCLGKDGTYTAQQQAVWRTVYLDRAPSLKQYVEEDKRKLAARPANTPTPEDWSSMTWAERVLEYASAPNQFQIITENLSGGSGTSSADTPAEDKAIEAARQKIAQFEAKLTHYKATLITETDPDKIEILETAVDMLESTITAQQAAVESLEQQKADRVKKAMLTMRNISSLLFALDSTGALSKTYMDGVGSAFLSQSALNADIHKIENYAGTLTDFIETFLNDIASNRISVFGSIDETGDLNALLRAEALDTRRLAALMVQSLVNAGGSTFLQSANGATATFSASYPKLTGVFRAGLIAAYVFTFLKVLQVVQDGTGNTSTYEKVAIYGTFSSLTIQTVRSLIPNVKNFCKNIFSSAQPAEAVPANFGAVGRFFRAIGNGIARGVMYIVNPIRAAGTRLAQAVANNGLFAAIRGFFTRFIGAVGRAVGWVRGQVVGGLGRVIQRIAASPQWIAFSTFMGKAFSVIAKGVMVVASIWTSVTEGINMVKVWQTSQSGWHKALVTVQFAVVALSSIATIIGVFSSAVVWSGAGAILALVAVGIGLLIGWLWPQESTIQTLISQVIVPFIDNTVARALSAAQVVDAPATLDAAEDDIMAGDVYAFA